jgi:hypothetical protein
MGAIPLVVVAYAIFVWIDCADRIRHRELGANFHLQNVANGRSVDALVFGGSNAVFSLSAKDLSYKTGLSWYNASLDGELNFVNNYENFIRKLSARIDRTKVKYVVYSNIFPYLIGTIDFALYAKRVNGEGIKPSRSVLHDIAQYISGRHRQVSRRSQPWDAFSTRQRDSFGDVVFDTVKCEFGGDPRHEREDEDVTADFLVDQARFFASVFPNASIFVVLPSEYYGILSFDDSIFEQNLRTKFYGLLRQKYHFEGAVKIIFQPPYSSITQVCDNYCHANEAGRAWRTENLIESIRAKNLFAGG